jgi:hypothetical protein
MGGRCVCRCARTAHALTRARSGTRRPQARGTQNGTARDLIQAATRVCHWDRSATAPRGGLTVFSAAAASAQPVSLVSWRRVESGVAQELEARRHGRGLVSPAEPTELVIEVALELRRVRVADAAASNHWRTSDISDSRSDRSVRSRHGAVRSRAAPGRTIPNNGGDHKLVDPGCAVLC